VYGRFIGIDCKTDNGGDILMVCCTIVLPKWKIVQETGIEESNTIVLEGGMVTT